MPAAVIGAALIVIAALAFRQSGARALRWLSAGVAAVYFLLGSSLGASWLMASLAQPYLSGRLPAGATPALIVVLSANASGPVVPGGRTELNGASWRRLWRAVEIQKAAGGVPPLLYSGRSTVFGHGVATESDMARASALQWGLRADQFWKDEQSRNTYESAVTVKALLTQRGISGPIVLVTSAWHMRRAEAAFARQGISVIPEPCDVRALPRFSLSGLVPDYEGFSGSSVALREWAALASYKMRGRI